MSVGTIDPKTTTYFVDSGASTIEIPAGVYEASSSANLTLGDAAGNSFSLQPEVKEICAQDGISAIFGSAPLSPTDWGSSLFANSLSSKTIAGVFPDSGGYAGVTTDLAKISSSNGKFFNLSSEYQPTYDAPEVLWTASVDAQAIPGNQLTFPVSPALQQGDLVLVTVGSDASTPNLPAGYTSLEATTNSDSYGRTFYKVMTATPDANVYVDGLSEASVIVAIAIRNVGSGSTGLKIASSVANGSSGMPDAPSVTTTEPNTLVVALGRLDDDSVASSVTAPTGYSNLLADDAAGLTGQTVMVATKLVQTPGAENPGAFGGTGDDVNVGVTVTLGPTPYFGEIFDAQKVATKYFATTPDSFIAGSDDLNSWSVKVKNGLYLGAPEFLMGSSYSWTTANPFSFQPNLGTSWKAGDVVFWSQGQYTAGSSYSITSPDVTFNLIKQHSYSQAYNRVYYFVIPEGKTVAADANYPVTVTVRENNHGRGAMQWSVWRNVDISTIVSETLSDYTTQMNWPAITAPTTGGGVAGIYSYVRNHTNANTNNTDGNWGNLDYATDGSYIGLDGIYYASTTPIQPGAVVDPSNSTSAGSIGYNAIIGVLFAAPASSGGYKFAANGTGTYVGIGGAEVFSSTNGGETWTVLANSPWGRYASATSIVFAQGRFIVTASNGNVYYSTNGTSWTVRSTSSTDNTPLVEVSEANGVIYAVNSAGSYFYSSDGFTTFTYKDMASGAAGAGPTGVVEFIGSTQWGGESGLGSLSMQGRPRSYFVQNYSPQTLVKKGDLLIFSFATNQTSLYHTTEVRNEGWKVLAQSENDTGITNYGMSIHSFYKFVDNDPINLTIEHYIQWVQDTSIQSQAHANISANLAVFRGADPDQPLLAEVNNWTSGPYPPTLPSIPEPHMQLTVAHNVGSWTYPASLSAYGWSGYKNLDNLSNSYGSVVMATKWFPSGGAGTSEQWADSSDRRISTSSTANLTVAIKPLTAPDAGEELAVPVASVFVARTDGTYAVGGGSAVLQVSADGSTPAYISTNIGGSQFKQLFNVGNQLLAVGTNKNIKYSGQISETGTLKLVGQVVRV
jgi:hypothetical protein